MKITVLIENTSDNELKSSRSHMFIQGTVPDFWDSRNYRKGWEIWYMLSQQD